MGPILNVTIEGSPAAIASEVANDEPSSRDGNTKTSDIS